MSEGMDENIVMFGVYSVIIFVDITTVNTLDM